MRQPLVVVHFWAVWNLHDRKMDQMIQKLMPRYADRIEFRSFDTDIPEGYEFCRDCGIFNLPALAAVVHGVRVETLIGLRPQSDLEDRLQDWIRVTATQHSMWDREIGV